MHEDALQVIHPEGARHVGRAARPVACGVACDDGEVVGVHTRMDQPRRSQPVGPSR